MLGAGGAVGRALGAQAVRGARRFGPATSKKGNLGYNRGRGAWKGGFLSSKGRFVPDEARKKFMVVPDLTGFELTPYVALDTPKVVINYPRPSVDPIEPPAPSSSSS
jgi:hypothetical protein